MSDSPRTDGSGAVDVVSDAGRDEKIEQLLLAGLDHYFAARYEQAVNVWTRALFLDRSHPRARAYIERARSAMAERQRESEELLHRGMVALNRGEGEEAKRLLLAAADQGAPAEEVHGLLDRLDRGRLPDLPRPLRDDRPTASVRPTPRLNPSRTDVRKSSRGLVLTMVGTLAIAAAVGVYWMFARDGRSWLSVWVDPPAATVGAPSARESMPPVPRRGEIALGRARDLSAAGQLQQALAALESVRSTDAEKPEADRMRAEIQQRLLAAVVAPRPSGAPKPGGRQP
jgi:tetratricopeptide (TPR) repeat protein